MQVEADKQTRARYSTASLNSASDKVKNIVQ